MRMSICNIRIDHGQVSLYLCTGIPFLDLNTTQFGVEVRAIAVAAGFEQ